MSVDEFLAWAEDRPGRYELVDGEVVAMSPERVGHARTKYRVHTALDRSIAAAALSCEMLPDGMSVPIDAQTVFEPDALVHCGERLNPDADTVPEPLIVVEVLSSSVRHLDTSTKLQGYFSLPSVRHFLILDTEQPVVIHHRRAAGDLIETRISALGELILDPPGFGLPISALFEEP